MPKSVTEKVLVPQNNKIKEMDIKVVGGTLALGLPCSDNISNNTEPIIQVQMCLSQLICMLALHKNNSTINMQGSAFKNI